MPSHPWDDPRAIHTHGRLRPASPETHRRPSRPRGRQVISPSSFSRTRFPPRDSTLRRGGCRTRRRQRPGPRARPVPQAPGACPGGEETKLSDRGLESKPRFHQPWAHLLDFGIEEARDVASPHGTWRWDVVGAAVERELAPGVEHATARRGDEARGGSPGRLGGRPGAAGVGGWTDEYFGIGGV